MQPQMRVHLTAAVLLGGMIGVVALFWNYPRLLVYLLLVVVAVLAYGALYLILAARMDPKPRRGEHRDGWTPEPPADPPAAAAAIDEPKPRKKTRRKTKNKAAKAKRKKKPEAKART